VTLNAAYRRPIEANFRQEHLGAARQTFHICPWAPVADVLMKPTLRPGEGALYRCGSLLGRGSEPLRPGKKRVGPKYWLAEAQESWSTRR
jgi:hypothetical protein